MKLYIGKKKTLIFIDANDFEKISKFGLHLSSHGYVRATKQYKTIYLHRLIMNPPDNMKIDHINGNKLDNRKSNLRICEQKQNCLNKKIGKRNKTGVPGVWWCKERKKWAAQISVNCKTKGLGRYINFNDAVEARKKAEIEFHGEYAATKGALA